MKKIGFLVVLLVLSLLFAPIIPGENMIDRSSDVTVKMKGSFVPYFEICNNGNTSLFNVTIIITIEGMLVLLGAETTAKIDEIPPGVCIACAVGFIFGFGPVTITITIFYDDGTISETFEGFLLGFFLFV
jgi:hypothetical protein